MRTILTCFLGFLYSIVSLHGQSTDSEACRQMLTRVIAAYSHATEGLAPNMIKAFSMNMVSEFRSTKIKKQESKLDMLMGHNLFVAKNGDMLSISDSNYSFTMVQPTRIIMKNKSLMGKITDSVSVGMSQKMLDNIQSFECVDYVEAGVAFTKVICMPNEALKTEASIDRIEYVIDPAKNRMVSSKILYAANSPMKTMSIKYTIISTMPKPSEYAGDVQQLFFTSANKLREAYKGYQFFDNTKNKK